MSSSSRMRRVRSPLPGRFARDRRSEDPSPTALEAAMGASHSRARSYDDRDADYSPQIHEIPPTTLRLDRSMSQQTGMRGIRRLEQRMTTESALAKNSRLAQLNPPLDLRLLDYLSSYDSNLMCPICRCPFVDPVVLAECDHCFCRDCIRQCWTHSAYTPLGPRGDCPTCRTPAKLGPRTAMSKILNNILEELVVKCPKWEEGCPAEMKRGEVQDHVRIYCGYTYVECPADDCELAVLRKDSRSGGCEHSAVSCFDCRLAMRKSELEAHWRSKCPDRKVECEMCKSEVLYRSLSQHRAEVCPATCIPCPGKDLGCTNRSRKGQAEVHARDCVLAKLAPTMRSHRERLDEQEAAQKQMVRKLEVLQTGVETMKQILADDPLTRSQITDDGRLIVSSEDVRRRRSSTPTLTGDEVATLNEAFSGFDFGIEPQSSSPTSTVGTMHTAIADPPARPVPEAPGPRPIDLPLPFSADFDLASPFPPPSTDGGPYASPLHHLLSMHESLRDEISRINTALQELEGRHGMQILNENLRTREEISYIGAQVAGLSRQVHWLTSSQLQRQHRTPTPGASGSGSSVVNDIAGAGAGVEAAVQTAASALRGMSRTVSGESSSTPQVPRRQRSEEGRTKL